MVSFNEISPTTRTPAFLMEFDASRAAPSATAKPSKALLIGQRRTGSVAALVPTLMSDPSQAILWFGAGSQLHQMAVAWFANNRDTEVWAVGLADPAGNAATGSVTFGGSPTEAGTAVVYVGGRRYPVAVAIGASVTTLASDLADQINRDTGGPITATPSVGAVSALARHVGVLGNDIDVRHSHQAGEALPAGLTVTIIAMNGGTGDAVVAPVWAAIGDQWFSEIVAPFLDATNLTSLENEMLSRATAQRHIGARTYAAVPGSLATAQSLGNSHNAPRESFMGTNLSPTLPWEVATMVAAQAAASYGDDPARPLQTLPLIGMLAPRPADRWSQAQRNKNLFSGISTFTVAADGTCQIERVISTYKTNPAGGADTAWLDLGTSALDDLLRWQWTNFVSARYSRHKVADDGTNFRAGQFVVTPSLARAELLGLAREWEALGYIEDYDQFAADLVVVRNAQDPSRLDVFMRPNLVNGLLIVAARFQFIL